MVSYLCRRTAQTFTRTTLTRMSTDRTGPSDTRKPFLEKFFECAENGNIQELRYLLKATGDVNQRNDKGWTALMFAARHGHVDIIKALLENGCDVTLVNKTGQTAQDIALFWDQKDTAEVITNHIKQENPDKQLRNFFSLNTLNRYSEKRKDNDWLNSQLTGADALFIPFSELKAFVTPQTDNSKSGKYSLGWVSYADIKFHIDTNPKIVFLGAKVTENKDSSKELPLFAIDVTGVDKKRLAKILPNGTFLPPFPGSFLLEPSDAGIFGEARSMLDWLDRYKFCATCQSSTTITEGGHKRVCDNKDCRSNKGVHNTCYPRTDPSVIMLVIAPDGKKCLLGRKKQFPAKMWSCLAGFMEPGEAIEDTVRREVEEESGVVVGRVDYHSSQPWPFPASLMIGCIAYATSDKIKVDEDEMEDAQWFRRPELVQMLTHQHPQGLYVPPEQAIAHQIIKSWVRMTANL